MWTLEDAFDDENGSTKEERNSYVTAASQWILIQGDEIYTDVAKERSGLKKWRGWLEQLKAVADGKSGSKGVVFSKDTTELAGRASVAMEAIERQKAG